MVHGYLIHRHHETPYMQGTDACDGAGLLAAILGYFVCKGPHCPKILVSTHFHGTSKK